MALNKQKGNMYPWVTHMHTHLGGECPHRCGYCYVQTNPYGVHPRYRGQIRLIEDELKVNYGSGKTIFIEHMSDLFAERVPSTFKNSILAHTRRFPHNEYVFQTKDPNLAWLYLSQFPSKFMMGTTIETNRDYKDTKAPMPFHRYLGIKFFEKYKTFITIEPIMNFDVDVLLGWILDLKPAFINIGADSKECNLPEPSPSKIKDFISKLQTRGVHIEKKTNLKRLLQ